LRPIGDPIGDDPILHVVSALKGKRLREVADIDRLLLMIDPESYGRHHYEGNTGRFHAAGADEPDVLR
jgi:hypothetical protein